MLYSIRCSTNNRPTKTILALLIVLLAFAFSSNTKAEESKNIHFVVVIKKADDNRKLERKSLRHIFMGTRTNSSYKAVHLPVGHPLRITFNTTVIGLTESRIQAYWAQLKFTGRGKPPMELGSVDKIITYLQKTPNVAAYLPADIQLPTDLAVIFP